MATIFTDRNTNQRERLDFDYPVMAGQIIYKGTIVSLSPTGFAGMHTFNGAARVVGISMDQVDNRNGLAGALRVRVRAGCHKVAQDGTITVATLAANRSPLAVAVDNQTVTFGGNNYAYSLNHAGYVRAVEPDGVWVDFGAV